MTPTLLSLAMIVKNEAANLPRCLASVAGVVDEMVVVDTGSSDGTPAIAAAAGASVHHVAWENDFAKARNSALERARSAWILVLDADEELTPGMRAELRELLQATTASALRVLVENLGASGDVVTSTLAPSVRVFRNASEHRYERSVHEQVTPSILRHGGTIADHPLRILHHGYTTDRAQGGSRAARNGALLDAEIRRTPNDPGLHVHAGLAAKARADLARAREHLDRALELVRGDGTTGDALPRFLPAEALGHALIARAQVALADGDLETAIAHACRAFTMDPENLTAAHVAAVALCMRGDMRSALPFLEAVSSSASTHPSLRHDVALLLAHVRRAA